MEVYKYLFFLDNGRITVITYNKNNSKKFSCVTKEGEKEFPITEDFWEWWKDAVCYIEGGVMDFCFIYDIEYSILSAGFIKNAIKPAKSFWTHNIIEEFLKAMPEYAYINLTGCNGKLFPLGNINILTSNTAKMFYTNIEYKGMNNVKAVTGKKENSIVSPLAEYYREILVSESRQA